MPNKQGQDGRAPNPRTVRILTVAVLVTAPLLLLWLFFGPIRQWSNHNEGFVAAIGVFVVVPFAIWASRLIDTAHRRELASTATNLLVYEIWHNLNYVGQIEQSYRNNFELWEKDSPRGVHVPHFGPRVSVLEKFITVEHLSSLPKGRPYQVLEIYAQLCNLREEFPRWREMLYNSAVIENRQLYEAVSSTMLSIIEPLMGNMMRLWANILAQDAVTADTEEIAKAASMIRSRIAQGQLPLVAFKASQFKSEGRAYSSNEKILCWRNDWPEAPVECIELCDIAAPFDTWRRKETASAAGGPVAQ